MGFYKNIKSIVRLDDKSNFNYTPHIDEVVMVDSRLAKCVELDKTLPAINDSYFFQCGRCIGCLQKPLNEKQIFKINCTHSSRRDNKNIVLIPYSE